jgi:hypothetical protein
MTMNASQENVDQSTNQPSDKELNFRRLEEKFNRTIEQERFARQQAEEKFSQLERMVNNKQASNDDDEIPDEPYVDHKRLQKSQARMEKKIVDETDNRIQRAVSQALEAERRTQWLKQNPDFKEVMDNAQKFADRDPELAETILNMPEGFERQKLVYKNIKALGLHKKPEPEKTIQETIDQNRRTPFYQPTNVGTPPYAGLVGFDRNQASNPTNQKNAYDQMKALQRRLGVFN